MEKGRKILESTIDLYQQDILSPFLLQPNLNKLLPDTDSLHYNTTISTTMLTLIDIIEHIPLQEHAQLFKNLYELQPTIIVITTPNKQFNKFFNMRDDEFRDPDHKFEMTAEEFSAYIESHCANAEYDYEVGGIEYPNPLRIVGQYKH